MTSTTTLIAKMHAHADVEVCEKDAKAVFVQ